MKFGRGREEKRTSGRKIYKWLYEIFVDKNRTRTRPRYGEKGNRRKGE